MFRSLLCQILSYSIALAPFATLPPTTAMAQQPAPISGPSTMTRIVEAGDDIDVLLDRAFYPKVPRRNLKGAPTTAELAEMQSRLAAISNDLRQNLNTRLSNAKDERSEKSLVSELLQFYAAAQRFETAKIVLGQKVDPETYQATYGISLAINDLSQLSFFEFVSLSSGTDVLIEGIKNPEKSPMLTALKTAQDGVSIEFRINPDFLQLAEEQYFIGQMNTRGALLFASHFAAHRLYAGQVATLLLSSSSATVPEPTQTWKERFASFKVQRNLLLQQQQNHLFTLQKPALVNAIKAALADLQIKGQGRALDQAFWTSYSQISGTPLVTTRDDKQIAADENLYFLKSLTAITRLWSLDELQANLPAILYFARRLSLRFLVLNNPELTGTMSSDARQKLSALIDNLAKDFSHQVAGSEILKNKVAQILNITPENVRQHQRKTFHDFMIEAANQIRYFEYVEINLQYLYDSKSSELQGLNPSDMVKTISEGLAQQPNYRAGYLAFKQVLLTILKAYSLSSKDPSLKWLSANQQQITFNPKSLAGQIPDKYLTALANDNVGRSKDLADLLKIGQILRFDIYESLPENDNRPTLANLKIEDRLLGPLFGSDKRNYLESIKKDLYTSAPILGSNELYTKIYSAANIVQTKSQLIDREVTQAYKHALKNLISLDAQVAKVEQAPEHSLDGASEELRTLITRASQISAMLSRYASFSGYFAEIRKELLMPGFWGQQWAAFNSWSNWANIAILSVFALSLAARWNVVAGRGIDVVNYFLAPVFGNNMSRIFPIFIGLIAVGLVDSGVRGFGTDRQRTNTLKKYFSCNAFGPCIALYSDVLRQEQVRNASIFEFTTTILLPMLFIGGLVGVMRANTKVVKMLSSRLANRVEGDLKILNIRPNTALNDKSLDEALQIAKRNLSRGQGEPLALIEAEQAYLRLQELIWKESRGWNKFDQRFKRQADSLGLNLRQIKSQQELANAFAQLEQRYAQGQISAIQYAEQKSAIFTINQTYMPYWQRMQADKHVGQFYDAVWDASTGISQARISGNINYFSEELAKSLNAAAGVRP